MRQMFLYIRLMMAGLLWKKPKRGKLASSQQGEWYHHCGHCPLDRFETCLKTGNLDALIISGTPSFGDLAEAWGNIYAEYLDLNNDNETIYLLQLQKEISLLTDLKVEVETALQFLSLAILPGMAYIYRPELVTILKDRDFDFPFDLNNPQQYAESLQEVENRLSPIRLQLEMNTKEYRDYISSKGNQTIDANYFDKMLTRVARFRHIPVIRKTEITVKEFVLMIQDYLDFIKSKQKTLEPDGNEG